MSDEKIQWAIDVLNFYCKIIEEEGIIADAINTILPVFSELLNTRQEPVTAEWIDKPTGAYGKWQSWCSACGKHSGIGGIESNRHKPYCPNCGATMKGVADVRITD